MENSVPGGDFADTTPIRDKKGDKEAFKYLLKNNDMDAIADSIDELETPEDISYHYETLKDATTYRMSNHKGKPLNLAYAQNENTPAEVLDDLAGRRSPFSDMYYGIDSEEASAIKNNPNTSQETKDYIDNNADDYEYADRQFAVLRKEDETAEKAFKENPGLKERIESVEAQHIPGYKRPLYEMKYDPQDVKKVGENYIKRHHAHFAEGKYNKFTGAFRGYKTFGYGNG